MDKKYSKHAWAVDINNWPVDVVELAVYNLNDLKLETTRFLLTPENEKEYYESREHK